MGLCPYISFYDGKVIYTDECTRDEGRCYEVCPRIQCSIGQVDEEPIGPYLAILRSRARNTEIRQTTQYGGTITALILLALKEGLIKKAVLTSDDSQGAPSGVIAQTEEEVMACSGSRYVGAGSLEAFNRAVKEETIPCGIVGLPCQAESLRSMQASPLSHPQHKDSVTIVLGLFCTWSLDYRSLNRFLKEKNLKTPIIKYDIPPPPANVFQVTTRDKETIEFPLDDIRSFVMPGCAFCRDMTAEKADLSVGTVEGMEEWNTLIIRTKIGQELLELADKKGVLELEQLPRSNLEHLKEASLAKRRRKPH